MVISLKEELAVTFSTYSFFLTKLFADRTRTGVIKGETKEIIGMYSSAVLVNLSGVLLSISVRVLCNHFLCLINWFKGPSNAAHDAGVTARLT